MPQGLCEETAGPQGSLSRRLPRVQLLILAHEVDSLGRRRFAEPFGRMGARPSCRKPVANGFSTEEVRSAGYSPGQGDPHDEITGICGRAISEAGRFGVSRRRASRHLGRNRCRRADRAPHDVWLRGGLVHQFGVLPVLAAGRRRRRLLSARRYGSLLDPSRCDLGQAGLARKAGRTCLV